MGHEGLREVVPTCFECPDKKACLQLALRTDEGIDFRGTLIQRSTKKSVVGLFKRWSYKKHLSRQKGRNLDTKK